MEKDPNKNKKKHLSKEEQAAAGLPPEMKAETYLYSPK
jgi:hypothetical protein